MIDIAKEAYQTYRRHASVTLFDNGGSVTPWEELTNAQRAGWQAAIAHAVRYAEIQSENAASRWVRSILDEEDDPKRAVSRLWYEILDTNSS